MTPEDLKQKAKDLGFDLVGVSPLGPFPEAVFYPKWLESGYAGEMQYLERQKAAKMEPASILPGARSVIVCAMNYNSSRPYTQYEPERVWVSRYAWGEDYHDTVKRKLQDLAAWIEQNSPQRTKAYVDTGPLLERVYAKYAGVGWFGKNTCIINQKTGSWLFLGCIVTDLELPYDTPVADRCGTCTRCIDACPTGAILEPYVLDSRKCIAYTTIELRAEIPEEDRAGIGHHLFGCDICQDVCPWNRKAPYSSNPAFEPRHGLFWPTIDQLLDLNQDEWQTMTRGTAAKRAKIKGLLRNLMVVAGNSGVRKLLPKLRRFLKHEDEHVRSHAEWAIQRLEKSDEVNGAAGPKPALNSAEPSGARF
ncbi:MAG: tRNA epoxyqueuosine(34) reductase QueG [Acidobacteria bacterium]|nr:MAG: tRNA epoxyqueuosine(34) reductase QueG [Acidobacteriota bacterium]